MLHRKLVVKSLMAPAILAATAISACTVQRLPPPVSASSGGAVLDDHMAHMAPEAVRGPMVAESDVDIAHQGHDGLPASNATAAARLKASPRHAEWVKLAWEPGSKDSLMAWVVYPKASGKAPVVVVVQEIYGLSSWIRAVADQAAADGFIAVAPDLFSRVRGGPSTTELTVDSAPKLQGLVNTAERNRGIIASANYAMMLPAATQKYAVIGYCWGGQTVFAHAVHGGVKGYSGGVAFYGAFPYLNPGTPATATTGAIQQTVNSDSVAKVKMPVMLLNGTGDARISTMMPAIDSLMKLHKKEYSAMNYQGAIHGFLRAQDDAIAPPRPSERNPNPVARPDSVLKVEQAANLAASRDAWPKTVAFLKKQLK